MQQDVDAVSLGSLAKQTLEDTGGSVVGEIVSVFPHSLYIKAMNGELIFVTCQQLRSPISVNLDSKINLAQNVKQGDTASLRGDQIRLGESVFINVSRAKAFIAKTKPQLHQLTVTKDALHLGSLILMIVDNKLSVLDQAGLANGGASKFVSDGVLPFRRSNDIDLIRNAGRMIIGLGTGFTPSGDDLLGGFLATYNSFTQLVGRQTINLSFNTLEGRTNWISAKLLDYMQRQILDEQMNGLLASSASQSGDFMLALEALLSRGHTSGIDILVGALLALCLVHDIGQKDDMTTVIARNLCLLTQAPQT